MNPGCCWDTKPVGVVGCGSPHINAATILQLSCDISTERAESAIMVWLVLEDGSKQAINPADISVAPGLSLEEYMNLKLWEGEKRQYMRGSIKAISENIVQKAPPPAKNRDHQQEKYRRRYHERKK